MIKKGRPLEFERQLAVDKALKLFWRKGYSAVSTDDLCKAMGLNKPSLYNAFGNKEDLYISCLIQYNQDYASKLISIMDKYNNPVMGVEKMLTLTAKQFRDPNFPSGCLAITGLVEVIGKSEKIDKHLRQVQKDFISAFEIYFNKNKIKASISHKKLAQYVVGQLYALAIFSKTNHDLYDFKHFIKMVRSAMNEYYQFND